MPFSRLRQFATSNRALGPLSGMIMFWGIFDGILIYAAPLTFSQAGMNNSEIGFVLGSSSLFGAIFDLVLSRVIKRPDYRKLYLAFFIACACVPLILWQATTVPFFLLVMLLWGLYFDFVNFGNLDFVSKNAHRDNHTLYFSVIQSFKSLGYIVAPVVAGIAIASTTNSSLFILMWITLAIAFLFFIWLVKSTRPRIPLDLGEQEETLRDEIGVWIKLLRRIWSPLIFTLLFCVYDAFFFTIGPLLAESYTEIAPFNGLVVTVYWLPAFALTLFADKIVRRFGKRQTAYVSLFLAAFPLLLFFTVTDPFVAMLLILLSAIFSSCCVPAIHAVYTDFIDQRHELEEDIEGIGDFMTNLGYVFGPILAGIIADKLGFTATFSFLAVLLIICLAILIKLTPKHISIKQLDV